MEHTTWQRLYRFDIIGNLIVIIGVTFLYKELEVPHLMILLLKVLCIYLLTIAIMRLMGKSTIIQMTPYDLVAIIIVGTIASEPLISTEFRPTLYALVILTLLHILFSKLTLYQLINRLFLGEPTLLIKNGEILEDKS